jgi:hypothetical protein
VPYKPEASRREEGFFLQLLLAQAPSIERIDVLGSQAARLKSARKL